MTEKERTDPFEEFRSGLEKLAAGTTAIVSGSIGDGINTVSGAYPYFRSVNENFQKYVFARRFVHGRVLDVPCGMGYGTAMLASAGLQVYGMDRDQDIISGCEYTYRYPNAHFVVGDMMDESDYLGEYLFGTIVCLDGLEHVKPGKDLLGILYSKLEHGGTLVVSAPVSASLELGMAHNRFHMEDYDKESFVSLIESSQFGSNTFYSISAMGDIGPLDLAFTQYIAVCKKE